MDVTAEELPGGSITVELGGLSRDTVELRDGSVVLGDVLSMSMTEVVVRTDGKEQSFPRNQVKKMMLVERVMQERPAILQPAHSGLRDDCPGKAVKPTKGQRPSLPNVSEQMKAWPAALANEISGWPQVASRAFFGLTALYRKHKLRRVAPHSRDGNGQLIRVQIREYTCQSAGKGFPHRFYPDAEGALVHV